MRAAGATKYYAHWQNELGRRKKRKGWNKRVWCLIPAGAAGGTAVKLG